MKTIEIIGYKRANLGKADAKRLRNESMVPCVIYGGKEQIHFSAPMILFRDLVYTSNAHFVKVNVEGTEYNAIMQDLQFHPVSEVLLHVDFLEWTAGTSIKMNVPVHISGTSPAVAGGGTLIFKRRQLTIKALPKNMPEFIDVSIDALEFGKAIKVGDLTPDNYEILDTPQASIAVAEIPRALRGKTGEEEGEEEVAEEAAAE
ncbi:MAG: 50S ribosomal protein L25/general stress protein Ctc [Reichenbachiella sp.]